MAAALSVAVAWTASGTDPMTLAEPEPWSWVPPAVAASLAAALVGWRRVDRFTGVTMSSATKQGAVVACWSFLLGCVLFPLGEAAADLVGAVAGGTVTSPAGALHLVWGTMVAGFLLSLFAGAVSVLPVALVSGGLAGWLVGRALGTAPEAGR